MNKFDKIKGIINESPEKEEGSLSKWVENVTKNGQRHLLITQLDQKVQQAIDYVKGPEWEPLNIEVDIHPTTGGWSYEIEVSNGSETDTLFWPTLQAILDDAQRE